MLVQSPDGTQCLLGRTKRRHRHKMYSCLAGFVEQCESVEDAVRRETWEESAIRVGEVQLIASQPWPIGAAGGSELMLGCLAQAVRASAVLDMCCVVQETEEITIDSDEMEDVR